MIDRYTKIVLTIIAIALVGIVVQSAIGDASAIAPGCGSRIDPCYITIRGEVPVQVRGQLRTD